MVRSLRSLRSRASLVRIEEILVPRAAMARERERKGEIPDLLGGVPVGPEREANAPVDGAPNEPLVRLVSRRYLERLAGLEQRVHETLLVLLGPQLLHRQVAERQRD